MYSGMRVFIIATVFFLLTPAVLTAQDSPEVILRFSTEGNIVRIVLESDDRFISNAITVMTNSDVKIEFPDRFTLHQQEDFLFEAVKLGRVLTIYTKNVKDLRSFKLFSPARLVIDLEMDQQSFIEPLVPITEEHRVNTIVINAGHGGYDFGIVSEKSKEKDINLAIAKRLASELSKKGKDVYLTRNSDQFVSLHNRVLVTEKNRPDLFISIHSSLSDVFVTYTGTFDELSGDIPVKLYGLHARQSRHISNSKKLSDRMQKVIKESFKKKIVTRELPLPVLNSIDAPAIMLEYPTLKMNTYDKNMIGKINLSILQAIEEYEQ
jgi:N-acetylmuramoyl-L-alanine amidase